ncbi:MAG: DUF1365 domain-containing protein [Terrimicrobiaceae bacterium]|nr:DUF1365 domain-containing protein [Terrimicrobiaceae bacterium]
MKPFERSCVYECDVWHRRLWPREHEFVYRVFLFAFDLDEVAARAPGSWLLGINRPGLYSLQNRDHFGASNASLRERAESFLRANGVDERPSRILLLTNARFLGYTFNPISVWFCEGAGGSPLGAIAEVGNTFGELKPFFVPPSSGGFHLRAPKHFYVSPFSDLDWEFEFRFARPGGRLGVWIDVFRSGDKALASSLTGRKLPLRTSVLLAQTARFPFITLKVISLIHWQALRLWLKRVPFHRKEEKPELQQGVFRPHRSLRIRGD